MAGSFAGNKPHFATAYCLLLMLSGVEQSRAERNKKILDLPDAPPSPSIFPLQLPFCMIHSATPRSASRLFDLSTMYSTWLWIAESPTESLVIGANAMLQFNVMRFLFFLKLKPYVDLD